MDRAQRMHDFCGPSVYKLVTRRRDRDRLNKEELEAQIARGAPAIQLQAVNSSSVATAAYDDEIGLPSSLYLSVGARVMVTHNLCVALGLCNGTVVRGACVTHRTPSLTHRVTHRITHRVTHRVIASHSASLVASLSHAHTHSPLVCGRESCTTSCVTPIASRLPYSSASSDALLPTTAMRVRPSWSRRKAST